MRQLAIEGRDKEDPQNWDWIYPDEFGVDYTAYDLSQDCFRLDYFPVIFHTSLVKNLNA